MSRCIFNRNAQKNIWEYFFLITQSYRQSSYISRREVALLPSRTEASPVSDKGNYTATRCHYLKNPKAFFVSISLYFYIVLYFTLHILIFSVFLLKLKIASLQFSNDQIFAFSVPVWSLCSFVRLPFEPTLSCFYFPIVVLVHTLADHPS